ncbi:hypothetical protein [uncultured Psychrobacter sp.]|uniref:hypothetical protein n=1 Tax=uncultured Psychrobacter sp. TaxID=259303 RepID=UPI003459AD16
MKQNLFDKLETGMPVTYQKMGAKEHNFYFVISKINASNDTVDIERYSKLTGKKDEERSISHKNVPLADIDFIIAKHKLIGLDPSTFFSS